VLEKERMEIRDTMQGINDLEQLLILELLGSV
jgi:hypothetical protein